MSEVSKRHLSVGKAIALGQLCVNGPVVLLLFGVPVLGLVLALQLGLSCLAMAAAVVFGFGVAWLWWSVAVPRWRLWALQRVDDLPAFQARAVATGLTWPRGHLFEKTEMKTAVHAARERELELLYYLDRCPDPAAGLSVAVVRLAANLAGDIRAAVPIVTREGDAQRLQAALARTDAGPVPPRNGDARYVLGALLDDYLRLLRRAAH